MNAELIGGSYGKKTWFSTVENREIFAAATCVEDSGGLPWGYSLGEGDNLGPRIYWKESSSGKAIAVVQAQAKGHGSGGFSWMPGITGHIILDASIEEIRAFVQQGEDTMDAVTDDLADMVGSHYMFAKTGHFERTGVDLVDLWAKLGYC